MWFELFKAAVESGSRQQVADSLGISRTAVSLIYSGKYPAKTDKIAVRVLEIYGRVHCPHLRKEISNNECRRHHSAEVPTSSPRAMRHWKACQSCPLKGDQHHANATN